MANKKYSDKEIEKCKAKIDFIKNKLNNVNIMDIDYRVMIKDILQDYETKLCEMQQNNI